jgi:hypothetical protein
MYIEFTIPSDINGIHNRIPAHYTSTQLKQNLKSWAERYSIAYRTKDIRYTVRLTFDDDKLYDFFALTWNPKSENFLSYLTDYRFVEPMNRV